MPIIFKDFNRCVPAFSGRWTPVYLEHGRLEVDDSSVKWVSSEKEVIRLPAARLSAIILGPGTTITHAAVSMLARLNTPVVWMGEDGVRFYAFGVDVNEKCKTSIEHARLFSNEDSKIIIAKKMFLNRYPGVDLSDKTLEGLRGMEGIRVRDLYKELSEKYNVLWTGRNSSGKLDCLGDQSDLNKMITLANHVLYCVCLSAIVTMGYIPSLGFVHVDGKIPFVYDIADLYKSYITIEPCFSIYKKYHVYDKDLVMETIKLKIEEHKLITKIPLDLKKIIC